MAVTRPFRFAAQPGRITSVPEWIERVRRIEGWSYSTAVMGQHLALGSPAQIAVLATMAAATPSLRLATHVIPDGFYPPGPHPVQRPHPPVFIGGGRRRMLELAAREADVVGLDLLGTTDGRIDLDSMAADVADRQAGWVREAAGERYDRVEVHTLAHAVC